MFMYMPLVAFISILVAKLYYYVKHAQVYVHLHSGKLNLFDEVPCLASWLHVHVIILSFHFQNVDM